MKEDFEKIKVQLNQIGIIRICSDFYMKPTQRTFVKSPASKDKHYSMKLYPSTNTFCDFANSNKAGDCIGLVAYINRVDNWQALKIIEDYYGLSENQQQREEIARKIKLQQKEEQRKIARKSEFQRAVFDRIDALKALENNYKALLQKDEIKSNLEAIDFLIEELAEINYKLNILCAISDKKYYRMKIDASNRLPSDRLAWIADVLQVLKQDRVFFANESELKELERGCLFW